jgi:hypothetical protein
MITVYEFMADHLVTDSTEVIILNSAEAIEMLGENDESLMSNAFIENYWIH